MLSMSIIFYYGRRFSCCLPIRFAHTPFAFRLGRCGHYRLALLVNRFITPHRSAAAKTSSNHPLCSRHPSRPPFVPVTCSLTAMSCLANNLNPTVTKNSAAIEITGPFCCMTVACSREDASGKRVCCSPSIKWVQNKWLYSLMPVGSNNIRPSAFTGT